MAKSNRICFLCGKKYSYCNTCGEDVNKPSWYTMWCSETCKDLDRILAAHTMQQITTEEAKNKIENLKLENINFIDENVKKHYDEIMMYNSDKNNIDNENQNKYVKTKNDTVTTTTQAKVVSKSKQKNSNIKFNEDKKK